MTGQSHEAFAGILQAAWGLAQTIREETGTVVELRLTTLGLTALAADAVCGPHGDCFLERSDAGGQLARTPVEGDPGGRGASAFGRRHQGTGSRLGHLKRSLSQTFSAGMRVARERSTTSPAVADSPFSRWNFYS